MARSKEERETCILVNDAGDATVWTTSPTKARILTRRLGKPAESPGFWRWDVPASTLTWLPRRKSKTAGNKGAFVKRAPVGGV